MTKEKEKLITEALEEDGGLETPENILASRLGVKKSDIRKVKERMGNAGGKPEENTEEKKETAGPVFMEKDFEEASINASWLPFFAERAGLGGKTSFSLTEFLTICFDARADISLVSGIAERKIRQAESQKQSEDMDTLLGDLCACEEKARVLEERIGSLEESLCREKGRAENAERKMKKMEAEAAVNGQKLKRIAEILSAGCAAGEERPDAADHAEEETGPASIPEFMNNADLSKLLGVHKSTVYRQGLKEAGTEHVRINSSGRKEYDTRYFMEKFGVSPDADEGAGSAGGSSAAGQQPDAYHPGKKKWKQTEWSKLPERTPEQKEWGEKASEICRYQAGLKGTSVGVLLQKTYRRMKDEGYDFNELKKDYLSGCGIEEDVTITNLTLINLTGGEVRDRFLELVKEPEGF